MLQPNPSNTPLVHHFSLSKCLLMGAGTALVLILIFLIPGGWFTQKPNPEWQSFWMIRPLIVVPLAGAVGGALFYGLDFLRFQGGWKTAVAYILSIVGFLVILWLGTVLGLAGTWWD